MTRIVDEARAIFEYVAAFGNAGREVVKRGLEFHASKPAILRQPVEHVQRRVELEIELMRIGPVGIGSFRRAELIHTSKCDVTHPRVIDSVSQWKLLSNSSSTALSSLNGDAIASTVNPSRGTLVAMTSASTVSNTRSRLTRSVTPSGVTTRCLFARFSIVNVGSILTPVRK